MGIIDFDDLIGRSFLMDKQEDGQRFRATIVEKLEEYDADLKKDPTFAKFRCTVNDDDYEQILTYNELLDYIRHSEAEGTGEHGETVWSFQEIIGHQGPLKQGDADYKGSRWNVMMKWSTGEITTEPLSIIAADDPVTCALYAREKGLLDVDGWKRFRSLAKREKHLLRQVNQARLRSYRTAPKYMFGYRIPRDYDEAIALDKENGNTKWKDATELEMKQLADYDTFHDLGHKDDASIPQGYKKIRTHLVYATKHDGRHKARMVADGHLTDVPLESVYSGVVSLRGLRIVTFLAEHNGLELWGTDIGNAYLEAESKERVAIIAGKEFGELEGHILIIFKALYGLRTSGLRWHERFADCLRSMGFTPSKAEPDIWMRDAGDVYEYIAVYVDDLAIAAKNPAEIIEVFQTIHNFKLKGTGEISYHLGQQFYRLPGGMLVISARRYIDKMVETYVQLFGSKPSTRFTSPLEKNDHPEIDDSPFLGQNEIQQYQSLVGAMQWAVSIGRFDIASGVMTLSSFRAMPRRGHLDRAKRIYGYLYKMKDALIRVATEEPDMSEIPCVDYDWAHTVYGSPKEQIPTDLPSPKGNRVTLLHYFDANLYHDMLTGRSVTGVLHVMNKMAVDWHSKKQATVETATYGSEFIAARTCIEQAIDLRLTLRYLGVPICEKSYVFGDNKSVIDSSTVPHAKLHKRHNALSFHRVREAIATKAFVMTHLYGEFNPADALSKHWGYQAVWPLIRPLLFWPFSTNDFFEED
jgi:hypothetical protein